MQAGLGSARAIDADDIGPGTAENLHRLGKRLTGNEPAFLTHRERGHHRDLGETLEDFQREQEFIQRRKGLEENEIATAFHQGTDLLLKKGPAILPGILAIRRTQGKRSNGSADKNVAARQGLPGHGSRLQIDFADLIIQAKAGEAHAICAKAVRFDDPRSCPGIFLVDARHQFRLREVQFLQAMMQWHAQFVEIGAGRAVAEDEAFVEKFEDGSHKEFGR